MIRIFDSLNWVENMKLSIDAGLETGKIVEATMCYTGDILDPSKSKYNLEYYINMAQELEALGTDIICIKDMAGLLKPQAAYTLIKALKDNVKAHILQPDGTYEKQDRRGKQPVNSQMEFCREAQELSGKKKKEQKENSRVFIPAEPLEDFQEE